MPAAARARRRRAPHLLVAALVGGLIGVGAPAAAAPPAGAAAAAASPAAVADPAAAPAAYSLQPVSGGYPGEGEPLTTVVDVSASGTQVLYATYGLPGARSGLLLRDRVAGTTRLVDHVAGAPDQPAGAFGAETAALSADGRTVVWVTLDDESVAEPGATTEEAFVSRPDGVIARLPRSAEAGSTPARAVDVSGDGSRAVVLVGDPWSAEPSHRVEVVDVASGAVEASLALPDWANGVTISDDGSTVAWVEDVPGPLDENGEPTSERAVAVASADLTRRASLTDYVSGTAPSLDADGSTVVYRADDGLVAVDTAGPAPVRTLVPVPDGVPVSRARISGDGNVVVYDDVMYDEGSLPGRVWAVTLPDGVPVKVAGSSDDEPWEEPVEGQPAYPLGERAWRAAPSYDGAVVALWVDDTVVAAVRNEGPADTTAPVWPEGAALTATPVARDVVRLGWPTATDDRQLRGYEVVADGRQLAVVAPSATSYDVTLAPGETGVWAAYTVRPLDTAGNAGEALGVDARGGAQVSVDRQGPDALVVAWEAAPARAGDVTAYRVLRRDGGQLAGGSVGETSPWVTVGDVAAPGTELTDAGLPLLTWFDYRVDLVLADGSTRQWSAPTTGRTDLPERGDLVPAEVRAVSVRMEFEPLPAGVPVDHYRLEHQMQSPTRATTWTAAGTTGPGAGTLAITAGGLEPRASYLWRVVAVLGLDWPEREHTETRYVTTASEGVQSFSVEAPRTADGAALVLGSDLTATAEGEPGLTAALRLWADADLRTIASPDVTMPMAETAPGVYAIEPYLLDGELPAIGWAEVVLADGARAYTRGGTVGPVSGRLDLSVAASDHELPGLELVLAGPRGTQRQPATAPGEVAVPLSPGTWTASLVTSDGDTVARSSLTVQAATPAALSLAPVRHALVTVRVLPPAGEPASAQTVRVHDAVGTLLATRRLAAGATEVRVDGLPHGTEVVVSTRLDDQSRAVSQPSVRTVLEPGAQTVELRSEVLPASSVTATVRADGAALPGATVTVRQRVDGRDWTFSAVTGADGVATVAALAGGADVTATAPGRLSSGTPARLEPGADNRVALDLLPAPAYVLRPHVYTTNAGGDPTEQPMDWATNIHLRVSLTVAGRGVPAGPVVPVVGAEGDVVELCANGAERGLSQGCTRVTLGREADVDLRLDLVQAGGVTARLVDGSGVGVRSWTATLLRRSEAGTWAPAGTAAGYGADAALGVPEAGTYRVVFRAGTVLSEPLTFTVADGAVVALGDVTLSAGTTGTATVMQALPTPVTPGGLLTFRVELPAGGVDRTALRATVPAGTALEAASVTVDGAPVAATLAGGEVRVPLTGSAATVVRYSVRVDATAPSGTVRSAVAVVEDFGGTVRQLGAVVGQVSGVTLTGPRTVTAQTFRLTGTAPAGAAVEVRQGDAVVGTATAGAGGRFTVDVALPVAQRGSVHELRASSSVDGVPLTSGPWTVRFEPTFVQPTRIVVDNAGVTAAGSRSIAIDPTQGVASFTMVYVPSRPVTVTAEFADASRVHDYVAHVGGALAAGTCEADRCTAVVHPSSSAEVGDIWVDYEVDAVPVETVADLDVPTVEELRHLTQAPFNDPRDVTLADAGDERRIGFVLGGTGVPVEGAVRTALVEYEPTSADLVLQGASGVPTYDLSVTGTELSDGYEIRIRGTIPLPYLAPDSALMPSAAAAVGPAGWPEKLAAVIDVVLQLKSAGGIGVNQLKSWLGTGDEEYKLAELETYINDEIRPCAPDIADQMQEQVDYSRATVVVYRTGSDLLNLLGLLGGSWVGGALEGVVALGANTAISETLDLGIGQMVNDEMAQITDYVMSREKKCDKRIQWIPREPGNPPAARPTWIFDPSGYVYEALETQRVDGVTATVLTGPTADGPWTPWDAAAFGQTNPQVTTSDGRYGWDVPQGWWLVRYEKEGYRTAYSEPLQVLPEHYDVNVGLHRLAAPAVASVALTEGADGIDLAFDEWMSVASVSAGVTVTAGGAPVAGVLEAVDLQPSPTGELARSFRFRPSAPPAPGAVLRVTVPATVVDHGGVALEADVVREVTVPGRVGFVGSVAAVGAYVQGGRAGTVALGVTARADGSVVGATTLGVPRLGTLRSTGHDLVTVDGARVVVTGRGTLGGRGDYAFTVTIDRGRTFLGDRVRVQVRERATGRVVYDTQPGAPDAAAATTRLIGLVGVV